MRLRSNLLIAACCLVAAPAFARHPGDPIKPGRNLFSKLHDVQVGQAAASQVGQRYQTVSDAFLAAYIKRIGDRLAATPEARQSGFFYSFSMLNVRQVNAFALPGGPMFIFTGLLNSAENEAQLAGVMAHEMSHVILRHATQEASKAVAVDVVARLLSAAAAARAPATDELTRLGLGFGANSFILHFSREAETDADLLGSHLMAEAGYNPIELAHFFEKLAADGNRGLAFFSDHPNPANRERNIEVEITGLPQRPYGFETGDFPRARTQALTVLATGVAAPGAAPPVAAVPGAPQAGWQQFRAPRFSIAHPANWTIDSNDQSSHWTIAPPEGLVKDSRGLVRVAYGAIIGYFTPSFGGNDLGAATLDLVADLHRDRPGLQLRSASPQNLRVGGVPAALTMLADQSPSGGPETGALLTVARPEGLVYVLCVAPQRIFPQMQGAFQQLLNSLRFPN